MLKGITKEEVEEKLSKYLTPSQTISHQERLHGREKQLEMIRRALRSPGRHIFIYGDRGVGKTSLAKTAAFISQPSSQELALVACDQQGSFADFVQDIAKKLYPEAVAVDRVVSEDTAGLSLGPINIGKSKSVEKGVIPQISTINDAVEVLRAVVVGYEFEPIVIIDEFDQLADQKDMKLFADLIKQVSDQEIGIRFIFCGIGSSLEELIGVHLSTDRYMTPVELEPLRHEARWAILENAAEAFGVGIDRETVIRVGHISDGFPYYIHLIGENIIWTMFDLIREVEAVDPEIFHIAITASIESSYTSLKIAYDTAVKKYKHSEEYEEVLWAVADGKLFERSTDDIYRNSYLPIMARLEKTPIERRTFSQRLNSLKKDGHGKILETPRRSWYSFVENMIRGYVRLRAEKAGLQLGPDHHFAP